MVRGHIVWGRLVYKFLVTLSENGMLDNGARKKTSIKFADSKTGMFSGCFWFGGHPVPQSWSPAPIGARVTPSLGEQKTLRQAEPKIGSSAHKWSMPRSIAWRWCHSDLQQTKQVYRANNCKNKHMNKHRNSILERLWSPKGPDRPYESFLLKFQRIRYY